MDMHIHKYVITISYCIQKEVVSITSSHSKLLCNWLGMYVRTSCELNNAFSGSATYILHPIDMDYVHKCIDWLEK